MTIKWALKLKRLNLNICAVRYVGTGTVPLRVPIVLKSSLARLALTKGQLNSLILKVTTVPVPEQLL